MMVCPQFRSNPFFGSVYGDITGNSFDTISFEIAGAKFALVKTTVQYHFQTGCLVNSFYLSKMQRLFALTFTAIKVADTKEMVCTVTWHINHLFQTADWPTDFGIRLNACFIWIVSLSFIVFYGLSFRYCFVKMVSTLFLYPGSSRNALHQV